MLADQLLLGQIALHQHPLTKLGGHPGKHLQHLLARGEQHQAAALIGQNLRQVLNDRSRMGDAVARVGSVIGHTQQPGLTMLERAGGQRADRAARQTGAVTEAVELAQRGQRCRGGQRREGWIPEILTQGVGGQNGAYVDFDVAAFGQGQPARGRRLALRVLQAELGPQRPIGLGSRLQRAKQRVPLLGLRLGDADGRFSVHRLLEHIDDAL